MIHHEYGLPSLVLCVYGDAKVFEGDYPFKCRAVDGVHTYTYTYTCTVHVGVSQYYTCGCVPVLHVWVCPSITQVVCVCLSFTCVGASQ